MATMPLRGSLVPLLKHEIGEWLLDLLQIRPIPMSKACLTQAAVVAMLAIATPAAAQSLPWERVELLGGQILFHGEGPVEAAGENSVSFWRPVTFGELDRPVAGRMDCEASATSSTYSDVAFDLDARYAAERPRRTRQGLSEDHVLRDFDTDKRRLDAVTHSFAPHQHQVLSLIVWRAGETLLDIRLTCIFVHGEDEGDPNYASLVYRYTAVDRGAPVPTQAPEAAS